MAKLWFKVLFIGLGILYRFIICCEFGSIEVYCTVISELLETLTLISRKIIPLIIMIMNTHELESQHVVVISK